MAQLKKTKALLTLIERFLTQKEISSYDENLLDEFACDPKTLERYLKELEESYDHIVTIKKSRAKFWKLIKVSDIFEEFVKNSKDISGLFLMAQEFDPEILKELEKGTLSKIAKGDKDVFLFRNSIMEDIETAKAKQIFKSLKSAIGNSEYRDIDYCYNETVHYKNLKCIKLLFMDNNWYLTVIDEENRLYFMRLSFIEKVSYSQKERFQRKDIQPYLDFLANAQNAMTLYGVEPKRAKIKATKNIAKYFQADMKKFLPSQTFLKANDDGSVEFSLSYTQELEILPFIQKWLPDLVILEPKELREAYVKKLKKALKSYN